MILPQAVIRELDRPDPPGASLQSAEAIIRGLMADSGVAIVSHEVLFNRLDALTALARVSSRLADDVVIVGYSRRQSEFLGSAYGQWHFRSPERTGEVRRALTDAGLDPFRFSGLERFLIAAVLTDMATARQLNGNAILHWGPRYQMIVDRTAGLGVTVSAGHIPDAAHEFSLVDDFHRRAGLDRSSDDGGDERVVNGRFDPDLIEAVNLAVMDGIAMPGPHEHNEFLGAFPATQRPSSPQEAHFLDDLKAYVDTVFWPENQAFCHRFGLDERYFRPRRVLSRPEIDAIVVAQARMREADPVWSARHGDRTASMRVKGLFEAYLATRTIAAGSVPGTP